MFVALLLMVLARFVFWAVMVCAAIVLALAAGLGVAASSIARTWNPQRSQDLHDASALLMHHAIRTAEFADNHRRWLLPNTQASKRYPGAPRAG